MTKVIGYLRVSTDGQVDGFGLDVQRERIAAYAKLYGLTIDEFVVDDGYTGTNLDRPGMKRIIDMCAAGEMSKVIVYKIDRLSRSQRRLLELIEDHFQPHNVAFVSVMEQFDTSTAFGRACLGILGVFAQLDRDTIVERMSNGKKAKAATGERAAGVAPYGYSQVDGRTLVNEDQARIVRRIFAMRDSGKSYQAICDVLNDENVPTPKGGTMWRPSTIQPIIENRTKIYVGIVRYTVGGAGTIEATNAGLALI
jgi:site-specific DNA recombinase